MSKCDQLTHLPFKGLNITMCYHTIFRVADADVCVCDWL